MMSASSLEGSQQPSSSATVNHRVSSKSNHFQDIDLSAASKLEQPFGIEIDNPQHILVLPTITGSAGGRWQIELAGLKGGEEGMV